MKNTISLIKKKLNISKIISIGISTFIILQLIIDMARNTFIANFDIFGISILEFINFSFLLFLLVLTVINTKNKKVFLKYLPLIILFLLYCVFHFYNLTKFNGSIINNEDFNFLKETYYIFRMYFCPFLFLFIMYYNKFCIKYICKTFFITTGIIIFSIVFLNIFKISFISYGAEHMPSTEFIIDNIFSWPFFQTGNYDLLTSKGWFNSANCISIILFMIFPINLYYFFSKRKIFNYIFVLVQIISMMMIGTKTSSFGSILILIIFYATILIIKMHKKNKEKFSCKNFFYFFSIIIFAVLLLLYSPSMKRLLFYSNKCVLNICENDLTEDVVKEDIINHDNVDSSNNSQQIVNEKEKFINELYLNASSYNISKIIINSYPPENDYKFWRYIVQNEISANRVIKTMVLNRVVELNNNPLDKWFGIGYTSNLLYPEKDYISEYYFFGIFGLLLLVFPYFIIFIICLLKMIFNFKKLFNLENVFLAFSVLLGLSVGFITGHMFFKSLSTYFLVFILYYLIYNMFFKQNNNVELEDGLEYK